MNIRPKNFNEFIGQSNLINTLKIFCKVCINENKNLKHCLFYGLPGTGKTSLANVLANELNCKLHVINGRNIHTQSELISLFSLVNENDIVFIDEIQSLDQKIVEFLYPMLEDFYIDIPLGKEFNKRNTRIKLPKFCMIAATTSIGKINKPLLDRFPLVYKLDNYSVQDIEKILINSMNILKMNNLFKLSEVKAISNHCKENPRIAINLLNQIADFKKIVPNKKINEILEQLKIYKFGLDTTDLEYLNIIKNANNNILGIKTLIQITGYDSFTIENFIEPFLFKNNLLIKTTKGRKLTEKGLNLLEKINIK